MGSCQGRETDSTRIFRIDGEDREWEVSKVTSKELRGSGGGLKGRESVVTSKLHFKCT